MGRCCEAGCEVATPTDRRVRAALWVALVVNGLMFGVEIVAGFAASSAALTADAADFLGDAANYGLSLFVLGMAPVWRTRAALVKGISMGAYGVGVLALAGWNLARGALPDAPTMGIVGLLALAANVAVAILLFRFRDGDANLRSVWLCSRNDAIGNVAVVLAAAGVFGTGAAWPDLVVAATMALLAVSAAWSVVRQARGELREHSMLA